MVSIVARRRKTMSGGDLRTRIDALMPEVIAELGGLTAIPSIAFPGFPEEPVLQAANATVDLLRRYGVASARLIDIPEGYPSVYGELPGPTGSPTVLLYSHYDVQPAPPAQGWKTDPFTPVLKNGRLYARGAADDKSGILQHAASIRALGGEIPIGIKVLIEGEEETTSHLESFVSANPEVVRCDAFLIDDLGNNRVNEPALLVSLRGDAYCVVEVRTLDHPVHSGEFGGAAPDALMTLIKLLATLTDDDGSAAVSGLQRYEWEGGDFPDDLYRASAGILDGVGYVGRGSLATRLWSSPSVTVLGMDVPSIKDASNVLHPVARAEVSMRLAAGIDGEQQLAALTDHLKRLVPYGAHITVERLDVGQPFRARTDGPAFAAARQAQEEAFGRESQIIGSGGSIPLLNTLQKIVPEAEFILWGAQDIERARIHGADESVDQSELARCILAQARFYELYGASRT
jgi:acetylornithine deacetylase/succinyl-diaminopimelate desuccinylase-like protein